MKGGVREFGEGKGGKKRGGGVRDSDSEKFIQRKEEREQRQKTRTALMHHTESAISL